MNDTTDQQAVTVADVEAARPFMDRYLDGSSFAEDRLDLAKAFAAHRLASVSSASAETLALQAIKAVTATAKDGAAGLSRIMAIANAAGVRASYSDLLQDPAVALIVDRPRTEWAHLFKPDATGCAIPPEGWQCSRARGHTGPCAASPEPVPATNQAGEVERDIAGETVCGFRVAAWRETHPEHGDAYGHTYSEHWSTPNTRNPKVLVERLFTETQLRAALATQPATSQPEETWMNDSLSLDSGLPATSQEGEAMALICAMAEYSPHVMQAQHGKTVCDDYARAAIIAATPTPPTLSEDSRTAIVRELSEERKRYNEGSPTWRAFGFCIDIAVKAS